MKERKIDRRFDRLCDALAFNRRQDVPWETEDQRGALNLEHDRAQHRKHHSRFEDLQN